MPGLIVGKITELTVRQRGVPLLAKLDFLAKMANIANMTTANEVYSLVPSFDLPSEPSSALKNQFKSVLERVHQQGAVCITRSKKSDAVLMRAELFDAMVELLAEQDPVNSLRKEYDAIFSKMQTAGAHAAYNAAFRARPEALGKAAVAQAKKRG